MTITHCPLCGRETLESRNGDYRFEPPAEFVGEAVVIGDAEWLECHQCGEHILPHPLSQAIERELSRRAAFAAR